MNTFISYNLYQKQHTLNETYESFVELKILAKEITDGFEKEFEITKGKPRFHSNFNRDKLYRISKIAQHDYKVIKDFVNSKFGILYTLDGLPGAEAKGTYLQPVNEYRDYKQLEKRFDFNYLTKTFPNGIIVIVGKLDPSVVIHELEHAYDDFRAGGKLLHTKLGRRLEKQGEMLTQLKTAKQQKEFIENRFVKTYYRTPHEMSAFFTKALAQMNFFTDKSELSLRGFNDLYEEFKEKYQGYEYLTPKDKKTLARKFSQYYYKLKERNIYEE